MSTTFRTSPKSRPYLFGGVVAATLLLTACGSGEEGSANAEDGAEMHDVNIGYFPLVHTATIIQADQAGYLEEAGIAAELVQTEGGAAAIPMLVSGEVDILYSNYTSILLAAEQGLPVVMVAGNDVATDDHGIFVPEDSDIEDLADLEGKSFAVNNLQNIGTVAIYSQLEEIDVTPDSVDLVEMPNPDMAPSATNGNVDAIWQVEPFQTISEQSGLRRIGDMFDGPADDMPVGGWATTRDFAENNPEIIEAFQEALEESAAELQDNHQLHLDLVPEYTEIDESVAQEIALPHYDTELDVEALQKGADMMDEYDIISEPLDVKEIVVD